LPRPNVIAAAIAAEPMFAILRRGRMGWPEGGGGAGPPPPPGCGGSGVPSCADPKPGNTPSKTPAPGDGPGDTWLDAWPKGQSKNCLPRRWHAF